VLCGKEAQWRPVALLVPYRGYTGKPWRMQIGVAVCGAHRKPLPDELFGIIDKLATANGSPKWWDYVVQSLKARGVSAPHFASTRMAYIDLDSEEAAGHDAALRDAAAHGALVHVRAELEAKIEATNIDPGETLEP
jgi:hypothetical protein